MKTMPEYIEESEKLLMSVWGDGKTAESLSTSWGDGNTAEIREYLKNHLSEWSQAEQDELLALCSARVHPNAAPTTRASLLAQLEFARKLFVEDDRYEECRYIVTGIIARSHSMAELSEADVFQAAYGDTSGRDYWSGWCENDKSSLVGFAKMLAAHNAKSADPRERDRQRDRDRGTTLELGDELESKGLDPLAKSKNQQILNAFKMAFHNQEIWMFADPKFNENNYFNEATVSHFEIIRGEAIKWLLGHADFKRLVPLSAKLFLEGSKTSSSGESVTASGTRDRGELVPEAQKPPRRATNDDIEIAKRFLLDHPAACRMVRPDQRKFVDQQYPNIDFVDAELKAIVKVLPAKRGRRPNSCK